MWVFVVVVLCLLCTSEIRLSSENPERMSTGFENKLEKVHVKMNTHTHNQFGNKVFHFFAEKVFSSFKNSIYET